MYGLCRGDSGGPLIVLDGAHFVQIGVIHGGIKCQVGVPSISTRLEDPEILEFVRKTAGLAYYSPGEFNSKSKSYVMLRKSSDFEEVSQVLIVGGRSNGGNNFLSKAEIVSLSGEDQSGSCEIKDYPKEYILMVGVYLDNRAIVCGGYDGQKAISSCYGYSFDDPDADWTPLEHGLSTGRTAASSVVLSGARFLVLGGHGARNTSEILDANGHVESGPDLPGDFAESCAVKLNSSHVFLAGGVFTGNLAYLLNTDSWEWTRLQDLREGRRDHVCGRINKDEVAVVGGENSNYRTLNSVEIYSAKTLTRRKGKGDRDR